MGDYGQLVDALRAYEGAGVMRFSRVCGISHDARAIRDAWDTFAWFGGKYGRADWLPHVVYSFIIFFFFYISIEKTLKLIIQDKFISVFITIDSNI